MQTRIRHFGRWWLARWRPDRGGAADVAAAARALSARIGVRRYRIGATALSDRSIDDAHQVIKTRAAADLPEIWSGHSLRRGCAKPTPPESTNWPSCATAAGAPPRSCAPTSPKPTATGPTVPSPPSPTPPRPTRPRAGPGHHSTKSPRRTSIRRTSSDRARRPTRGTPGCLVRSAVCWRAISARSGQAAQLSWSNEGDARWPGRRRAVAATRSRRSPTRHRRGHGSRSARCGPSHRCSHARHPARRHRRSARRCRRGQRTRAVRRGPRSGSR
ncbi:hypothetical protein SAMN05216207_11003 [Pseudonocardia ammonioxydans]|uniref:Uncharacterized protein n=1 Tax=Pseudonocardia ammonioxydans TaxID=260086 RepID=A0A1I5IG24_PSUAM|nr:hypothetical protein SAMN05216207_11003 [Pseudonocardia ammonioxydans]